MKVAQYTSAFERTEVAPAMCADEDIADLALLSIAISLKRIADSIHDIEVDLDDIKRNTDR